MSQAINIPDEIYAKISSYATAHNEAADALVARLLSGAVAALQAADQIEERDISQDPLFQIAGMFAGNDPDWVNRHDEYLAETHRCPVTIPTLPAPAHADDKFDRLAGIISVDDSTAGARHDENFGHSHEDDLL